MIELRHVLGHDDEALHMPVIVLVRRLVVVARDCSEPLQKNQHHLDCCDGSDKAHCRASSARAPLRANSTTR